VVMVMVRRLGGGGRSVAHGMRFAQMSEANTAKIGRLFIFLFRQKKFGGKKSPLFLLF